MHIDEIKHKKQQITERFGPWTAHCIHLAQDLYTWPEPWPTPRLRRYVQIAADLTDKPLDTLRVLDLACLEGHFGIEFALHGSKVLAIEGREANLTKARFAKEALSLDNLEVALDDVRNLNSTQHGQFDVVLCLGILYHLDAPDAMEFLERVSGACRRITIIDTHISLSGKAHYTWRGQTYRGEYAKEHDARTTAQERLAKLWYSLDNANSFHFTIASLCNLLEHVGFTSVHECLTPYVPSESGNRITLVAIKGQRPAVRSSPITQASQVIDRPEEPRFASTRSMRSAISRRLPEPVKSGLRRIVRRYL